MRRALTGLGFGLPAIHGMMSLASGKGVPLLFGFPSYGGGPFERHGICTTALRSPRQLFWRPGGLEPTMRVRAPFALFALACLFLAGCAQGPAPAGPLVGDEETILASPAAEALWDDPQQFPHPAFGWPTITNVPADAPAWWQPIAARSLPDPVRGVKHLTQAGEGSTGDGIAVSGASL
ncbi:MAG TPA: hypothetical protein VM327_02525 [Candidatus Thermoplasmatota archaeon]|nr:hypothetical protein [Candidatus Thermoplasmatota archaeon]